MARRHSAPAHPVSVARSTATEAAGEAIAAAAASAMETARAIATAKAITPRPPEPDVPTVRVETVETNTLSGPIMVPVRRPLAETALTVHPLALGGSTFGWTLGTDEAFSVLDRFAGTGGDLLDTADSYAAGRSESIIGSWMVSRRTQDRMRVMTKVGRHPDHHGLAPVDIRGAVDDSLTRLRTDRIDVLFFHGDDPRTPLEESLGAVDALITAGKVRSIGAADFSPERLIEARVLAANGLPRFEVLTTRYNLMERRPFEGATELVAHAQGLGVLPYFALANGFLGGRVRRRSEVRRDTRGLRVARHLGRRGHRVLTALDEIAFAHGVQPATIALAWLLAKPTVAAPVASATRPDQVEALMAAACVELHRSELVELDRVSA